MRIDRSAAFVLLAVALAAARASAQALPAPRAASPAPDARVEDAVVQVFATIAYPDATRPWTKLPPHDVSGSGVIIAGHRILTNAHLVGYAGRVEVQANHSGDRVSAVVEAIGPGIDLAILKLDDDRFFAAHPPLERASAVPSVKDSVVVYGFPKGGSTLSVTKGIVSRIEFTPYSASVSGLRIQIDAAVNAGNSGGPAVVDDKMIGIVRSHLGDAQNIGYIVPTEEVELFLADVADGRYDGKPALYDELQTLESEALRAFLRLPAQVTGIVVHRPDPASPADPLKEWDVITRIGETPVDNQGMVEVRGIRVSFAYLVQSVAKAGKVPLTVWRGGKEVALEVPTSTRRPLLVPELEGSYPPYFIYGPLVFSRAFAEPVHALLSAKGNWLQALTWAGSPLVTRRGEPPAFPGEELVMVPSPLFPHKLAKGYSNPATRVLRAVNGAPVKNLRHVVEVLRDARDEFVTFDFAGRGVETIVLRRQDAAAATEDILKENGIRAQGSADLLEVWKATRAAR